MKKEDYQKNVLRSLLGVSRGILSLRKQIGEMAEMITENQKAIASLIEATNNGTPCEKIIHTFIPKDDTDSTKGETQGENNN